jgi:L-glyceraldehyde 3-phosphate reductase
MGLEYVDIFYSHRPDPDTPLEETMGALAHAVKQGKALYAGISNYPAEMTQKAEEILRDMGVPLLIHQPRYNMLDRWVEEDGLMDVLGKRGIGSIVFSPLAQGLLTNKYLKEIPENSRMANPHGMLQKNALTPEKQAILNKLNDMAGERGQSLAQMAIAWLLKDERVTSVLVGASSVRQLSDNLKALDNLGFSESELKEIEEILKPLTK